jgi:hypothetical protein
MEPLNGFDLQTAGAFVCRLTPCPSLLVVGVCATRSLASVPGGELLGCWFAFEQS